MRDMNITLFVDENVLRRARAVADAMGKSLDQMVGEYLAGLAAADDVEADIAELRELSAASDGRSQGWKIDRDELHRRT
jgi:hypothetical protein